MKDLFLILVYFLGAIGLLIGCLALFSLIFSSIYLNFYNSNEQVIDIRVRSNQ